MWVHSLQFYLSLKSLWLVFFIHSHALIFTYVSLPMALLVNFYFKNYTCNALST